MADNFGYNSEAFSDSLDCLNQVMSSMSAIETIKTNINSIELPEDCNFSDSSNGIIKSLDNTFTSIYELPTKMTIIKNTLDQLVLEDGNLTTDHGLKNKYIFFDQADKEWQVTSGKSMAQAGCLYASMANAISNLMGTVITPIDCLKITTGDTILTTGGGNSNNISKLASYYNLDGAFFYIGAGKNAVTEALQNGYAIVKSTPSHYTSIVDYDATTGLYLMLDSDTTSGTNGNQNVKWVSYEEAMTGTSMAYIIGKSESGESVLDKYPDVFVNNGNYQKSTSTDNTQVVNLTINSVAKQNIAKSVVSDTINSNLTDNRSDIQYINGASCESGSSIGATTQSTTTPATTSTSIKDNSNKISESEFNRSTAMQDKYGTYENYVNREEI